MTRLILPKEYSLDNQGDICYYYSTMGYEEKTERNLKIFCEKEGIEKPEDYPLIKSGKLEPKDRLSYQDLIIKYHLSLTSLQKIVNRERARYG